MRPFRLHLQLPVIALLPVLLLAGCGSGDDGGAGEDVDRPSAGSLSHVDGIIVLEEDELVLTPSDGEGRDVRFTLGPEVEVGAVRAIEASGAPARVSYRPGKEPLVAAAVSQAPGADAGQGSYEGQVVSVDDRKLVIDGPDGKRTFDVSGAEAGAFDVPHLQEHAAQQEPVRVYFDPARPEVGLAYEDA